MDKREFMRSALGEAKKGFPGPPVPIVPFADWDFYYLSADLVWKPAATAIVTASTICVPRGFVTDLASIPRVFWSILPPAATYAYPAIIHDYLYWTQLCDRLDADSILKIAMRELKVSVVKVNLIHTAVRYAGWVAWSANAAAKRNGERRVLIRFPGRMDITWADWKLNREVFSD